MTLHGLLTFALVDLIFVVTPGPGIAAMVARGLGSGRKNSVAFALGFVAGDITWFTIAATGLAALAASFATAFTVLKYAGCAYLIYLAWKMWVTPVASADVQADPRITSAWSSFAGSLTLTWSNPKTIGFFVSLMPLVVDVKAITLTDYLAMAGIIALIVFVSAMGYLSLASRARRIFTSRTALTRINRGAAALMAGAAALIAVRG